VCLFNVLVVYLSWFVGVLVVCCFVCFGFGLFYVLVVVVFWRGVFVSGLGVLCLVSMFWCLFVFCSVCYGL